MKRAVIFLSIACLLFFAGELIDSSLTSLAAFFAYFLVLLTGGIALTIELLLALFRRCRWRTVFSMAAAIALSLLPFAFMMEIRESIARAEDFFFRSDRLQVLETIQSEESPGTLYTLTLPEKQKHLAEEGQLLILKINDNYCAAAFWNRSGFLGGGQATVYCSDGNPPTEDLLNTPEIYLCKPLGEGWFFTSFE